MQRNDIDREYISLLSDVVENGVKKNTRSGLVRSVFGRMIRFDLFSGFPLLTTKDVSIKNVLVELLWFLKHPYDSNSGMNIRFLAENGVHIWDGDAYRWYCDVIFPKIGGDKICDKGEFMANVMNKTCVQYWDDGVSKLYTYGDLGPVYGSQWRAFGGSDTDQIYRIIDKLRTDPNDRRMLCIAYNPNDVNKMALPPCHVMFQFYTRPLTSFERNEYYDAYIEDGHPLGFFHSDEKLDELDVPRLGLSCMWSQRSVDMCLGLPYNIASYAALTYMIGNVCNMAPCELIGSLGDCHVYDEHVETAMVQMSRSGSEKRPSLLISGRHDNIDSFELDDFRLVNYEPEGKLRYNLFVG